MKIKTISEKINSYRKNCVKHENEILDSQIEWPDSIQTFLYHLADREIFSERASSHYDIHKKACRIINGN